VRPRFGGIETSLLGGGGGSSEFTFKILIMALTVAILLPMGMSIFAPAHYNGADPDEVLDGYANFTGQDVDPKVSVWPLTGIFTPFLGGSYNPETGQTVTYGYSEDGWLFGSSLQSYSPSQYAGDAQDYVVYKDSNGVFRYWSDSADYNEELGTGHKGRVLDENNKVTYPGDLYTEVNFEVLQKSDIFFTESSRTETTDGHFYYDYSGYRLAFQPISNYTAVDSDGNRIPVIATTTSLSLVWYEYLSQSGITGQLVLSGSNGGIAYLNAANILSAFNSSTNTAAFPLVFNGVELTVYIKIDPMKTSNGYDIEQCYNLGYWSIMVTSLSADADAYTGTDSAVNPMKMLQTMIDILTFNLDDYSVSSWMAVLVSVIYVVPLYAGLITLCLEHSYLWIMVGILAAVQAIGSIWPF
jgi:hypothetical protein